MRITMMIGTAIVCLLLVAGQSAYACPSGTIFSAYNGNGICAYAGQGATKAVQCTHMVNSCPRGTTHERKTGGDTSDYCCPKTIANQQGKKDTTGGGTIGGSRCQMYVADALLKAAANIENHCGYPAEGRFTQNANLHRRFCEDNMKANNLAIINSEEAARATAIDKCIKK